MGKWTVILAIGVLAVAAFAQPATPPPSRGHEGGGGGFGGRWTEGRDREAEWKEAYEFFKEHSPRRAAVYEKLTDDKKKSEFRFLIIGRFRAMSFFKSDDQVHQNKIKQMEIEDRIFGLRQQWQEKNAQSAEAQTIKAELKKEVGRLIEARLEERRLRLEALAKVLKEEQDKLQKDEGRREEMVKDRLEEVLSAEGPDAMGERMHRRGPGGGPDRQDRQP